MGAGRGRSRLTDTRRRSCRGGMRVRLRSIGRVQSQACTPARGPARHPSALPGHGELNASFQTSWVLSNDKETSHCRHTRAGGWLSGNWGIARTKTEHLHLHSADCSQRTPVLILMHEYYRNRPCRGVPRGRPRTFYFEVSRLPRPERS